MRYFKCDTLKPEDRKKVYRDVALTEEEKKRDRQGKILNLWGTLLSIVVFLAAFGSGLFLIVRIPVSSHPVLLLLTAAAIFILVIVALLVSVLVASLVSSPIHKKAQKKLVIQKRICFDESILLLRDYYGLTEPCVVTKCYDSVDQKFRNRDVCIFLAHGELRITADLKHGFSIRENDPGCYAFSLAADEISLELIRGENFLMTELKSGDTVFLLGRRAKGFIETRFLSPKNDTLPRNGL